MSMWNSFFHKTYHADVFLWRSIFQCVREHQYIPCWTARRFCMTIFLRDVALFFDGKQERRIYTNCSPFFHFTLFPFLLWEIQQKNDNHPPSVHASTNAAAIWSVNPWWYVCRAPGQSQEAAFVRSSVCCSVSVRRGVDCRFRGRKPPKMKRTVWTVTAKAVSTQPICESQNLRNGPPSVKREDVPVKSFKLLQLQWRWKRLDRRFDVVELPRPRKGTPRWVWASAKNRIIIILRNVSVYKMKQNQQSWASLGQSQTLAHTPALYSLPDPH